MIVHVHDCCGEHDLFITRRARVCNHRRRGSYCACRFILLIIIAIASGGFGFRVKIVLGLERLTGTRSALVSHVRSGAQTIGTKFFEREFLKLYERWEAPRNPSINGMITAVVTTFDT